MNKKRLSKVELDKMLRGRTERELADLIKSLWESVDGADEHLASWNEQNPQYNEIARDAWNSAYNLMERRKGKMDSIDELIQFTILGSLDVIISAAPHMSTDARRDLAKLMWAHVNKYSGEYKEKMVEAIVSLHISRMERAYAAKKLLMTGNKERGSLIYKALIDEFRKSSI
jgi:hypothetical protein